MIDTLFFLRSSHAALCRRIFFGISIAAVLYGGVLHAGEVALRWDAPEAEVSGYKIHYGTESRNYTQSIDVANTLEARITDLEENATYYFAATAYITNSAAIVNAHDPERDRRVIRFDGAGLDHGYRLWTGGMSEWGDPDQFIMEWGLKYSEPFEIFIDIETTRGHRYLTYPPVDGNTLGDGEFVRQGIGAFITNGGWHTVVRDLQKDLEAAQPDTRILAVNSFMIRGSGSVDDIKLHRRFPGAPDPQALYTTVYEDGEDGLSDRWHLFLDHTGPGGFVESGFSNEVAAYIPRVDTDGDGLPDSVELAETGTDPHDPDTDGDGSIDGMEIHQGTSPLDGDSAPAPSAITTVYEDGNSGTAKRWHVYLDLTDRTAPPEAAIVSDPDRNGNVVQLSGSGIDHGYRLRSDSLSDWGNTDQFILQWSMNYSENFEIFIDTLTAGGRRYLIYSPAALNILGKGQFVRYGIGDNAADGTWRTFVRDLQADLETAQPGATILGVNGFLIRGSGRVDDIMLHGEFR